MTPAPLTQRIAALDWEGCGGYGCTDNMADVYRQVVELLDAERAGAERLRARLDERAVFYALIQAGLVLAPCDRHSRSPERQRSDLADALRAALEDER